MCCAMRAIHIYVYHSPPMIRVVYIDLILINVVSWCMHVCVCLCVCGVCVYIYNIYPIGGQMILCFLSTQRKRTQNAESDSLMIPFAVTSI